MFRVSDKMTFGLMQSGVRKTQTAAYAAQRRAQTGLRVERVSDDPAMAARSELIGARLLRIKSMDRVAGHAEIALSVAESTLGVAGDVMVRVQELAIQALNGTMTSGDRIILAREVTQLREQMLSLANTQNAGEYIFGGFDTDTPPFLNDGSFVGAAGERQVEVSPGVMMGMNVSGDAIFGTSTGTDVFATLDVLISDLNTNDEAAIQTRLGELETVRDQITDGRATLGIRLDTLGAAEQIRIDQRSQLETAQADAVAMDPAESYVDLVRAQSALQGALAQAQKILAQMEQTIF